MSEVWVCALVVWLAGPPALPPLPGENAPEAPEAGAPTEPSPSKPARQQPEPEPEPEPNPSSEDGGFSIPAREEPPQPGGQGPRSDPQPAATAADPPRAEGPTAAPRIGDVLPTAEASEVGFIKLPPPVRPPYRGTGLFIGAGVAFTVALTEQIIAHRLVKTRCIDPIGRGDYDTTEDVGEAITGCAPGVLPALALRVHSDIGLLAAVGLAAAGGITRGNRDAYGDVFDQPGRRREVARLRVAGISLIGAGVVSWLTTGAAAWGVVGNCGTARCVNGGRLMAFITRDISAAMVASGAGMLAFAETYRRRHDGYTRDRALSVGPSLSLQGAGLRVGGRF